MACFHRGVNKPTFVYGIVILPCILIGCASIPKVPRLTALELGPDAKPLTLKKVACKLQRGTKIGNVYGGLAHVWQATNVWKGGRVSWDPTEYHEELRDRLEGHGYKVVGDPDALFEDRTAWEAEFLVGALVKDLKLDLWYPWAGYGNFNTGKGSGYMEINWQIYSRRSRSVELSITTKGSAHDVTITDVGPSEPLLQAFGAAANNLMAERKFVDLIAPAATTQPAEKLSIVHVELTHEPAPDTTPEDMVNTARASVLTIFAGDSLGSGFIISPDGFVLTNQHVVGDAKVFTAKTFTGREVRGEVIRIDRVRDVALLKLEQDKYQALPLGDSSTVQVGSEVYAIGSPLDEKFGQSVTKGIIGGFRVELDQRFIQSDVTVHPGNSGGPMIAVDGTVVGIAAQAITEGGAGIGINLFIPVEEAISTLAIEDATDRGNP